MKALKDYQILGFGFSFFSHLIFILLVVYLTRTVTHTRKTIILDFSLENVIKTGKHLSDTKPVKIEETVTGTIKSALNHGEDETKEEPLTEVTEKPVNQLTAATGDAMIKNTVHDNEIMNDASKEKQPLEEMPNNVPAASYNDIDDLKQSEENQYIKEHFDYISKIIRFNISYPYNARNRAMEGNVLISFIISLDGTVKDITIEKSSGFSLLDKNTEKAVRKASPFPQPPVEAKITIPITYKLASVGR